ncbi:SMI1/KNR4 family protein [Streptomyces halstedii]|uniref:SMI1/KNR4 family protein n=1 Tax=Streptomyces halstedii TaxID=1944 RepID=UPI00369A98D0
MDIDNWQWFLERWNAQWTAVRRLTDSEEADEEDLTAGGLGFPPAGERRTAALEQRLGTALPPSYRAFLQVSDGWRHAGSSVYLLAGTGDADWHRDPMGMKALHEEQLDEGSAPSDVLMAGMWERALRLSLDSDMTDVLLDPGDIDENGEWAVYVYKGWSGEYPERYGSFAAFMREAHRKFVADQGDDPRFEDELTRELDASVERARVACLAGEDVDAPAAALGEARSFGRPRARVLREQIDTMLGRVGHLPVPPDMADPMYVREVMPVLALEHCRSGRDDDWFLRRHGEEGREAAKAALAAARERTFRYVSPGAFGRAVDEAREQARWGDADTAWRTLATAVPDWEPYGPEHLAPIGLTADPLLGPLVTPERGRHILTTPRAGHGGRTGTPVVGPERDGGWGLGWVAQDDRPDSSYRFVAVEGFTPRALAERLCGGEPLAPHTERELWRLQHLGGDTRGRCLYRVGSCGGAGDWSFAYDHDPEAYQYGRVRGLGAVVAPGTRSVSVWCERNPVLGRGCTDVFHFSYAEDGETRFTVVARAGAAEATGTAPDGLDPALFGTALFDGAPPVPAAEGTGPGLARDAETRALDAIGAAFGIGLPRFALRQGSLHAAWGPSWIRPPGPGEPVLTFVRRRSAG